MTGVGFLRFASGVACLVLLGLSIPAAAQLDTERPEAAGADARADAPAHVPFRFGLRGQVLATADFSLYTQSWSASEAHSRGVTVSPSAAYFVANDLALGLVTSVWYQDYQGYGADGSLVDTKRSGFGFGPSVAWNLPIGERFSLFPELIVGLQYASERSTLPSGGTIAVAPSPSGALHTSRTGVWLSLHAPLLFQLTPGFFMGFGPRLYHDFASSLSASGPPAKRTTVGAGFEVGGFWGGPSAPTDAFTGDDAGDVLSFGARGTWVVTDAVSFGGTWSSYSGTDAHDSSFAIRPAADYFFDDGVSLGASVGYSRSSADYGQGALRTTTARSGFSVFAKLGRAVTLSKLFSWYPGLGLGVGHDSFEQRAGGAVNEHRTTPIWFSLSAPLLVHVTRHFFLGAGPYVSTDISRKDSLGGENLGTTLSLSALAGGVI